MENIGTITKLLFPRSLPKVAELENKYPLRKLQEGAMVTRIAPSPTGFMHIGGLYTALISERFAHQTKGIFYLRIEDTDRKREVDGASILISKSLYQYGIKIDEGIGINGKDFGSYGPYKQSRREEIYKAVIKSLLERGSAYPCFCTPQELEDIRHRQEAQGSRLGYYGPWAKWRDKSVQEISQAILEKKPYTIRFKSNGDFKNKVVIRDELLGTKEFRENDQDIVILKSDGLPTYHMAHVIDDHFMRTTHVIRGDEWLSSLPLHLQLFESMEWEPPHYAHISPIQKVEGLSKRKLSKRKDPESNVEYYDQQGYPNSAILEYLLNLANSNFEDWRKANSEASIYKFILTFDRLKNSNGAIFDFDKLNDISKEIISGYSPESAYNNMLKWAKQHDVSFARLLEQNPDYSKNIIGIERSGDARRRKDLATWAEAREGMAFFFDENFSLMKKDLDDKLSDFTKENVNNVIQLFMADYVERDTKQEWFDKLKNIAGKNNYAESTKEYKNNPGIYRGNIADVARIFRVALTGMTQTPDLYSIMQVMGTDRVLSRLSSVISVGSRNEKNHP